MSDDNWRAVADIAPLDEQRAYAPALAARYLLVSLREDIWTSLAVYADKTVVGHVMWAFDDDGCHWVGGMLVDAAEQSRGIGRAAVSTILGWLVDEEGSRDTRLSYHPANSPARNLYDSLGFVSLGIMEDDELVARWSPAP